jgi:hypothetical protein
MASTKKIIKLNNEFSLQIVFDPLYENNQEVDLNRLLFIDYMNLSAEVATFSIVYSSIGFLVADLRREVVKAELELKIFKSKAKKEFREDAIDRKKRTTIDEADDYMRSLPEYRIKNLQHIEYKHRLETIESLYWASKSKDDKLQKLSSTISSQDFTNDLMNTSVKEINFVRLKKIKPLIQ